MSEKAIQPPADESLINGYRVWTDPEYLLADDLSEIVAAGNLYLLRPRHELGDNIVMGCLSYSFIIPVFESFTTRGIEKVDPRHVGLYAYEQPNHCKILVEPGFRLIKLKFAIQALSANFRGQYFYNASYTIDDLLQVKED